MRSRLARVLVLVCIAAVATGCSKTLKIDDLETEIGSQIDTQLGTAGNTVACPDDVKAEAGATFECTATLSTGDTVTVEVKQTDAEGHITWTLVDPAA
jgi:translation initiation factor IF-1